MSVPLTYPGVYLEEVPSGVRTITGVATSITAFIGRARRGPVNQPVLIHNFADFERRFGGLWLASTMSYAVRDFYLNGGSTAIIVRLFNPEGAGPNQVRLRAEAGVNALVLEAAYEGSWATGLQVTADALNDLDLAREIADNLGIAEVAANEIFNLTVNDPSSGIREVFNNVTVVESRRRLDRVLKNESALVRVPDLSDLPDLPESFVVSDPTSFERVDQDLDSSGYDGIDLAEVNYMGPGEDDYAGSQSRKKGLYALEDADLVNLLCLPPYSFSEDIGSALWSAAAHYAKERRAFLLVDPPSSWNSVQAARDGLPAFANAISENKKNAALFFPRVRQPNPLRNNQREDFAPCGAIAGIFARTDAQRGVSKASAGLEAGLVGVLDLNVHITDDENGQLNPLAVNCLRLRPAAGNVVWGARTLAGNDQLASEWKYIPVRRLALFLQESLFRGTQWAVFEPNDEPLWAQLRLNIGAFMQNLFRQGAFQGRTPKEAYFVKCDKETTTQHDIDLGLVNILVGFAPLKPAEFVRIHLQQQAGEITT